MLIVHSKNSAYWYDKGHFGKIALPYRLILDDLFEQVKLHFIGYHSYIIECKLNQDEIGYLSNKIVWVSGYN